MRAGGHCGDARTSLWAAQAADGRDTLSDEAPAEGCDRDGPARTRLQSHARDEYYRCSTTPGGDEGIVALLYAFDLETKRGDALAFTSEGLPERKGLKLGKMTNRRLRR